MSSCTPTTAARDHATQCLRVRELSENLQCDPSNRSNVKKKSSFLYRWLIAALGRAVEDRQELERLDTGIQHHLPVLRCLWPDDVHLGIRCPPRDTGESPESDARTLNTWSEMHTFTTYKYTHPYWHHANISYFLLHTIPQYYVRTN